MGNPLIIINDYIKMNLFHPQLSNNNYISHLDSHDSQYPMNTEDLIDFFKSIKPKKRKDLITYISISTRIFRMLYITPI